MHKALGLIPNRRKEGRNRGREEGREGGRRRENNCVCGMMLLGPGFNPQQKRGRKGGREGWSKRGREGKGRITVCAVLLTSFLPGGRSQAVGMQRQCVPVQGSG
jgi:hypothetical protein